MGQEDLKNKRTKIMFTQNWYVVNLGIMSLSAVLKQHGFETDMVIGSQEAILKKIQSQRPRVVGFYATTGFHHRQLELAREIKKQFGDEIMTIFGGPHPTFVPEVLEDPGVDIICRGEGEYALLELMEALESGSEYTKIQNLNIKLNGKIHENPLRPLNDLDALPFPDREVYRSVPYIYSSRQHVVMLSKGCPYNCAFCSAASFRDLYKGHGNYVRFRSMEKVMEELSRIKERYHPTSFLFYDESFFRDKDYTSEFLKVHKTKIGIPYMCQMRADSLNEETAKTLKETGCFFVCFGIDHGNEALRNKLIGKNLTDAAILESASILRKHKIPFATLNILGFPGDTISHVWDAVRINACVKPTWSKFFVYQTLPATKLAEYSLKNGFIDAIDVAPSDSTLLTSGTILRRSGECKKILRLKYLANIYIKVPFLRGIIKNVLLDIPADFFYGLLEKLLGLFYYYYPQLPGHRLSEKLSVVWFFIKHREEFE